MDSIYENLNDVISYQKIIDCISEGALLLCDLEIIYANVEAVTLLGASNINDLIGVNVMFFLKKTDYRFENEEIIVNEYLMRSEQEVGIFINDMKENEKYIIYKMNQFEIKGKKYSLVILKNKSLIENWHNVENEFRQVVEQTPIQIILTDLEGFIQYANPCFLNQMGYSSKEVMGRKMSMFKSGEQDEAFYKDLWLTIKSGECWKGYLKNKTKSGKMIFVSAKISTIKNGNGKPIYYLAVEKNITSEVDLGELLKNRTEELIKLNNDLMEAQNQLIQKEKLAGIGQLAAGVAHEINNPLGFIMSNTTTLKSYMQKITEFINLSKQLITYVEKNEIFERNVTIDALKEMDHQYKLDFIIEDFEELFDDMNEGLDRVKNIVKGLRMFSRIDEPNERIDYNINEGLKDTLVVVNSELKYDAKVELDLDERIPDIKANSGQMNQVFLNLLINAIHAIRSKEIGMGTIKIKTVKNEQFVECMISDNGIGIDSEIVNKIFDPFFTTKPAGVGTGLGLSISYDIMTNKHNGYLNVDSQLGVGTIFKLGLPIDDTKKGNQI